MPLTSPLGLRLVTMAVAQFFDFGTFVRMVQIDGIRAEANPIVANLVGEYGVGMMAVVKIALVVLVGATTVYLSKRIGTPRAERLALVVVFTGIVGGLVGGGSNALAIGPF